MSALNVQIRLFGGFRRYSSASEVTLSVPSGSSAREIKGLLAQQLAEASPTLREPISKLVQDSVLADETRVLGADEKLERPARLAILPPVCGG